jgi:hypothetical protein
MILRRQNKRKNSVAQSLQHRLSEQAPVSAEEPTGTPMASESVTTLPELPFHVARSTVLNPDVE